MIPINNADPVLLEEIEKARREWHFSVRQLDFAQEDFVECAVQRINSALAQYLTLLKQAQKCGLTAWDVPLKPLSIETESEPGEGSSTTDTEQNQTK